MTGPSSLAADMAGYAPTERIHGPALALLDQATRTRAISEARGWIADCFDPDEVAELTNAEVLWGIDRHYCGGWPSFLADSGLVAS